MVSIIVPVHNCKKWLPTCLDSLINQTYSNLEILLINDGSTDGCLDICEEYAEKDRRIRLLNKENGGVSSARNAGLRYAIGKWIMFVDADDWLEIDTLEKISGEVNDDFDCYFWDVVRSPDDKRIWKRQYLNYAAMEDIYCTVISGIKEKGYHFNSLVRTVWGKLYRTEIIKMNCLMFDENLYIGEDAIFLIKYLQCLTGTERIKVLDCCCYHYRITDESAAHRYKNDLLDQSIRQLIAIQNFWNQEFLKYKKQTTLTVFCWNIFNNLITNEMHQSSASNVDVKWNDAKIWFQRNISLMKYKNVNFWRMPRFVRIEWLLSQFINNDIICRISAFCLKIRYRP